MNGLPPPAPEPVDARRVRVGRRLLVAFAGSDYLRRSWSAALRTALARAIARHGPDAAASRVTTGNLAVYAAAERALARFSGMREVVLTSSGYTAPLVAAQALAPDIDGVWIPADTHPCLRDAARLTGLPITTVSLSKPPPRTDGRPALFVEGLGALTGRVPPLGDWLAWMPRAGRVLLDDAHGVGTLGERGRGILEHLGVDDARIVLAFTLSKAFGLAGGVVAGPRGLADLVWKNSSLQRASTPLAPAFAAVAPSAAEWMTRHGVLARRRLAAHTARLARWIPDVGDNHAGPVFLLAPLSTTAREGLRRALLQAEIFPSFIRYPGVPGDGAFRFAMSTSHTAGDIDTLGRTIANTRARTPSEWRLV